MTDLDIDWTILKDKQPATPEILPPLPPQPPEPKQPKLGTAVFESPNALYFGPPQKGTFVIACSKKQGHVYGINDDRHVAIIANPRAGKSAGSIALNAITHGGSMVALDIKGELASTTARARANGSIYTRGKGQRVAILDPFGIAGREDDKLNDLRGFINPLDFIDPDSPEGLDDAIQLADALCPEDTSGKTDPYFPQAARTLVQCVIMHVLTSGDIPDKDRHLGTVLALLAGGESEKAAFWRELEPDQEPSAYGLLFDSMRRNKGFGGKVGMAGERFAEIFTKAPKQFLGMLEIANRNLEFLQSPGMSELFSRSSFDLADLKRDPKGLSIYLCLPPRMLETHSGFFRSVLTMIIRELEKDIRPPASGAPVLLLLDEFAALKRMRIIENAIAQIAGYGVRIAFAVQALPQLKEIYKDNWETFMSAVGLKLFFGNEDHFTRDYVSKLVGETEITLQHINTSLASQRSLATGTNTSNAFGETHGSSDSWGNSYGSGSTRGPGLLTFSSSNNRSVSKTSTLSQGTTRTTTTGHSSTETDGTTTSNGYQTVKQARPLIRPDEVGRFHARVDDENEAGFPGSVLALVSGHNPIVLKRSLYFREPMFEGWYDPHPAYPYPPTLAERLDSKIADLSAKVRQEEARTRQEQEVARENYQLLRLQADEAAKQARLAGEEAQRKEHAARVREQAEMRSTALKRLLIGLVFLGPILLGTLIMGLAFTGYYGGRLLSADSFTFEAAWRAVKAFPLMQPERWGPHLANALMTIIGGVVGAGLIIVIARLVRFVSPFIRRKFNG